jgi:DNA-binding PadR family transcriptional regulator
MLGLVLEHPGHPYEIAKRLSARIGEGWGPINVYRLATQLEQAQLIRVAPVHGSSRRASPVLHPTDRASADFTAWIEAGLPVEPVRGALLAKLAVARRSDAQRMLTALQQRNRECSTALKRASEPYDAPSTWEAMRALCIEDAERSLLQCELDWVHRTRAELSRHIVH